MEQYIPKSVLVAEIEKRKKSLSKRREDMRNLQCYTLADDVLIRMGELYSIQDFLNTLEVKEVDLEKEINDYFITVDLYEGEKITENTFRKIAKHFFELGLKAQKGEEV